MIVGVVLNLFLIVVFTYFVWFLTRRKPKPGEPPIASHWLPWLGLLVCGVWVDKPTTTAQYIAAMCKYVYGSGLNYKNDPIGFIKKCEQAYGPIFTVLLGGKYFTFVVDPSSYPNIAKQSKNLTFTQLSSHIGEVAFGIKLDSAEVHSRVIRKLLTSNFQRSGLNRVTALTMKNLQLVINRHPFAQKNWQEMSLLEFCYQIIFPAEFNTLLGKHDVEETDEYLKNFKEFDGLFPSLVQGYPVSSKQQILKRCWNILFGDYEASVLGDMYKKYQEIRQCKMKKTLLSKHYWSVVWAAESNTCLAAFWMLYYILKHPEAKLAATLEAQERRESSNEIEHEDIALKRRDICDLPILGSIIKETLRLGTSVFMMREAANDCKINIHATGEVYKVRKDDKVLISQEITSMDPDIYESPENFNYRRFLNDDGTEKSEFYKNGQLVKYYLQTFGLGASICPGRYWAMSVLKQFANLVLLRYDIQLMNSDHDVKPSKDRTGFGSLTPSTDPIIKFKLKPSIEI